MNEHVFTLLREAAEWRLIGLLFECPGDDWQAQVAELAAEVADADLKAAAEAARAEASAGLYGSAFGPGGPAAPREVSYRQTILPGTLLSELTTHYRVFAYGPVSHEPPDHVAVMAGFVGYLRLKEAYAYLRGDEEQAAVCGAATNRMLAEHLNPLAEPLAESLGRSGILYLAVAATALLRRVGPRIQAEPVEPDVSSCAATGGCGLGMEDAE